MDTQKTLTRVLLAIVRDYRGEVIADNKTLKHLVFDVLAKNEDAVRSAAILADVITSYNKCNNVFSAEWSYEIDKMPKDGSELLVQIVKKDDLMKIKSYAVRWSGDLNSWICNGAYSLDITDYPLSTVALRWAYIPKEY